MREQKIKRSARLAQRTLGRSEGHQQLTASNKRVKQTSTNGGDCHLSQPQTRSFSTIQGPKATFRGGALERVGEADAVNREDQSMMKWVVLFLPHYTVIINNSQIMKSLSFRNSSRLIASILPSHEVTLGEGGESFYDEDLQFSTFRSDDYRFYEHFPMKNVLKGRDDTYLDDSSFEELERQEDSESEEDVGEEKKHLSSYGSTNQSVHGLRSVSFRNTSKTLNRILGRETAIKRWAGGMRNLNFRNSSVLLYDLLEHRLKQI